MLYDITDIIPREGGTGIELENAFGAIVEKNLIHDVTGSGIGIMNYGLGSGFNSDDEYRDDDLGTVIRNNVIYNAGRAGI